MIFKMSGICHPLIVIILFKIYFNTFSNYAQNSDILIQQYNIGPALDDVYSRWTVSLGAHLNRIDSDKEISNPLINFGAINQLEFRIKKSFGVITGVNYNRISYNYPLINSVGKDELVYYSFPFGIRLHPTNKVSFAIGGLYNNFNRGKLTIKYENFERSEIYAIGIFENSIGGFTQVEYNFLKDFHSYLNFRWATKNNSPTMPQSNNTSGFQIGISYQIWSSRARL